MCAQLALARCAPAWSGGIRASLRMQTAARTLSVERVEAGGPSARAGLRPGELVLAIDGISTHDMTESELRERVRGDVGTVVVLRVRSVDGRERDVRIERGP